MEENIPNMTEEEKLQKINAELREFYDYCDEAGLSEEEIEKLCRPLTEIVRKACFKRCMRILCIIIMITAIGYTVSQTETVQWKVAALGRVLLVKILPFWDWTKLHYSKCLLKRPHPFGLDYFDLPDCISCEAIHNVDRISRTNYDSIFNNYLVRSAPVIVTDAYSDWFVRHVNFTSFIRDNERLSNSVPCRVSTNIKIGYQPMDLEEIVSRIMNKNINWFVHYQNCDVKAVKAFRVLAPKPYFLPSHIPPAHFNWFLISKDYDTHKFKLLELDVGLIIMSQLKGSNYIQLKPRSPCEDDCAILDFVLKETETLVLDNTMWDLEYLPGKWGENVAMITETDWEDHGKVIL